jgi:signal transduction histidine kinase
MDQPLPPPWDGPVRADESFLAKTAALVLNDPALALQVSHRALREARSQGHEAGVIRALLRMASAEQALGRSEAADKLLADALARCAAVRDEPLHASALSARAIWAAENGLYADALYAAQEAIALAQLHDQTELLRPLLSTQAGCLMEVGDCEAALDVLGERRRLIAASGEQASRDLWINDYNEAFVSLRLGMQHLESGNNEEGHALLVRARELAERAFDAGFSRSEPDRLVDIFDVLVQALLEQGDIAGARRRAAAVEEAVAGGLLPGSALWGSLHLALAPLELAESGTQASAVRERLQLIERIEHPLITRGRKRPRLLRLLSLACEACADARQALQYHQQWAALELRARSNHVRERANMLQRQHAAQHGLAMRLIQSNLQQPLTEAVRQLETLAPVEAGPAVLGLIEGARRSGYRALDIAEQAHGIMLAEQVQTAELTRLDLSALACEVCEQTLLRWQPEVRLQTTFARHLWIRGERTLLSRAIANLLDNAIKYGAKEQAVHVQLQQQADEISLSVVDQGPGMPAMFQRRLFQRYTSARPGQGHGLGLALVARVARLHGARVTVRSGSQDGTCVALHFDAADPA